MVILDWFYLGRPPVSPAAALRLQDSCWSILTEAWVVSGAATGVWMLGIEKKITCINKILSDWVRFDVRKHFEDSYWVESAT